MAHTHAAENAASTNGGFPVVGIGASAGGLEAFSELLSHLPGNNGFAYVLVQHLDPAYESLLVQLLGKNSPVPVIQAADGMPVEPDHAYVMPADSNITISHGVLRLTPRQERIPNMPIDQFLRSLADERKDKAIAVILSGTGTDGSHALEAIKSEGGVVFAQDDSARFDGMPRSAIATGCVDFVLRPSDIAAELGRIGQSQYFQNSPRMHELLPDANEDFTGILNLLRSSYGIDFAGYKRPTISRRIARRMSLLGIEKLDQYLDRLKRPGELENLYQDVLIKVTQFFRDPEMFAVLQERVFPEIIADRREGGPIRIWVGGCATGEEAYSIAISLLEVLDGKPVPLQIFATDVSEAAIQKSRAGKYLENIAADVSSERLRRFFVRVDNQYRVSQAVRDTCVFARHSLTADPPFTNLDLISCRNVLMYLEPALQRRIISLFSYALRPNRCLALGLAESLGPFQDYFSVIDQKNRIFAKKVTTRSLHPQMIIGESLRHLRETGKDIETARGIWSTLDLQRKADSLVLGKYAPAGVIVDDSMEILQFRGDTSRYLVHAAGKVSCNVLKMAKGSLLIELRAALDQAKEDGVACRKEGVQLDSDGSSREISLQVIPFAAPSGDNYFLILFDEVASKDIPAPAKAQPSLPQTADGLALENASLKKELAATREYMQKIIEEREAANEQLQSASEEIVSSNEELKSINEELHTAKEELQSGNEELATLNDELGSRNNELNQANSDLTSLLSSIDIPVVMLDQELRVRRLTPASQRVLGLTPADVGRPISAVRQSFEIPNFERVIGSVVDTLEVREIEAQDRHGRWYSILIRPNRTLNNKIEGAVITVADIDLLKRSQLHYRELYQGILSVDRASGQVLDANTFLVDLLGYGLEEIRGKALWEVGGFGNFVKDREAFEDLKRRGLLSVENLWLDSKGGRRVEVDLIGTIHRGGNRDILQFDIRDITQRRQGEEKFHQRQRLESIGLLAGGVAHDFNNLLTGILGNASLAIEMFPQSHPVAPLLDDVVRASEKAALLTRQLLAYAGKGRFIMEPVNLSDQIRQISGLVHSSVSRKVQLTLVLRDDLPTVDADESQIQQLAMNLIINAAESIGDRAGTVTVSTKAVHVDKDDFRGRETHGELPPTARDYVCLEVQDSGSGMNESTKARIFDPFFTTKATGRGLGLSAVLGIVRAHNGVLEIETLPGVGATFRVFLPPGQRAPAQATPAVSAKLEHLGTILVVDDEPIVLRLATMTLEREGFDVLLAEDGQAAIDILKRRLTDVSLVLLDLTMPVLNGKETLEALRQVRSDVRVVLSSGYNELDAIQRFGEMQLAGFLQKPYAARQLTQKVKEVLASSRGKHVSSPI